MKKSRRKFLKDSGLLSSGLALSVNNSSASSGKIQANEDEKDIVICVFQRGAADGLHSVVPYAENEYFDLRPQTAVNNSIDLDGFFGLNPDLSAFKTIWDAGDLGIIHAVGSTSDSRSHFDAQDTIEYANLNSSTFRVGWLAKYLSDTQSESDTVFRSISMNDSIPKSIRGNLEALTVSDLTSFDIHTHQNLYADTKETIDDMYVNDEQFSETSSVLFAAIDELQQINIEDFPVDNDAQYEANSFATRLKSLGVVIKANLGVEIACVDIGGWDHHNNIIDDFPGLANTFSKALLAFYQDMGNRMEKITILCVTEFGRRAAENASLGTDHGHAGVMYTIGKQINGGEVYTDWPGLNNDNLNRGDLEVTTDFREVFSELLVKRLKYNGDLENIIPNFAYSGGIGVFKD